MRELQCRVLDHAVHLAGGKDALCAALGLDRRALRAWMEDEAGMPERIFVAVVKFITDDAARSTGPAESRRNPARAA